MNSRAFEKYKLFIAALLIVLLTAEGTVPVQAAAAKPVRLMRPWLTETADEGQCGDDIFYRYDAQTETVTVEGAGETWDYDYSLGPTTVSRIFKVNGDVRTLVIGEGIAEIKAVFIPENENLETIVLPESVVKIGNRNFHYDHPVTIVYGGTRAGWDAIDIDGNNAFMGCELICTGEWFVEPVRRDGFCFEPRYRTCIRDAAEEPDHTDFRPCEIGSRNLIAKMAAGALNLSSAFLCPAGSAERWYEDAGLWANGRGIHREFGRMLDAYTCCAAGEPVTIIYRCD